MNSVQCVNALYAEGNFGYHPRKDGRTKQISNFSAHTLVTENGRRRMKRKIKKSEEIKMDNQNICEFCGQVLLDGRDCDCYAATKKEKPKRKLRMQSRIYKIYLSTPLAMRSFRPVTRRWIC